MASPASKVGGTPYNRGGKNSSSDGRITDMKSPADGAQSRHHWAPKEGPSARSKGEPPSVSDSVGTTPVSMVPKRQVRASGAPAAVSDSTPAVGPSDQWRRWSSKANLKDRDGGR